MAQFAYPDSDIENPGGWTVTPLWEKIDEEPFDDGDFAYSPKTATGKSFTIGLSIVLDPVIHTGHIIRIRAETGVSGTFKYELMQGVVIIKDSGNVVLTTAFAEYNMTLSEVEAANITDYAALRVRVTAVITQKNKYQDVSWIRFEVPDVAGGLDLVKIIDEVFQFNEGTLKPRVMNRIKNEAVQSNEDTLRPRIMNRIKNEAVQSIEGTLRPRVMKRIKDETVQFVETKIKASVFKRIINETIQFIEAKNRRKGMVNVIGKLLGAKSRGE